MFKQVSEINESNLFNHVWSLSMVGLAEWLYIQVSLPLKALTLKVLKLNYSTLLFSPPTLHLPQLSPTHLSLSLSLVFLWVRGCHQGDGCHCRHGDGLHRASQLLSGTINKHQSLVNISPAAQSSNLSHSSRVHMRCIMERWWKTKGNRKQTRWE